MESKRELEEAPEKALKPLEKVYWIRLGLGILAALVCLGLNYATNTLNHSLGDFTVFINGLAIALAIYMLSFYILKPVFITKVAKSQKILTTGIGIYFFGWIVFWTMLYTIVGV